MRMGNEPGSLPCRGRDAPCSDDRRRAARPRPGRDAASTWDRPRSATRASTSASPRSAVGSSTAGTSSTARPESLGGDRRALRFLPEILRGRARGSRRWSHDGRRRTGRSRSSSAATTRSRWGRSAGARAAAGRPAESSGSTRTATSTRPRRARPETFTACRSLRRSASAGEAFAPTVARAARGRPGARRASRRARRWTRPSACSSADRRDPCRSRWREIDRLGIERAVREAIDRASGPGCLHVSLDLDALDPEVAPGVGTPVKRRAHLPRGAPRVRADLAESGVIGSLELVEVNPILDRENGSAAIAVELAASALGQSIL